MLVSGVVALGITLMVLPLIERCLRHLQVFDHPSVRSFHEHATLRGGGIALAIGALAALAANPPISGRDRLALACPAVLFATIGLVDDLHGVDPRRRLAFQVAAGAVGVVLLVALGPAWPAWGLLFLLWLVAFVNAFNFMDGINGISCVTAIVAGGAWWAIGRHTDVPAVAVAGVIVAAVALAFLPFNFPTARLFLGDVGSYFIGAWLASIVVLGLRAGIPVEALIAPLALYLVDTGVTLARRVLRGERWYEAHCEHTYQRLMQAGWSHAATTGFVGGCTLVISSLGALSLSGSVALRIAGDLSIVTMLVGYLAFPRMAVSPRVHRTTLAS